VLLSVMISVHEPSNLFNISVNHRGLIAAARIFSTFEGPTDGSDGDVPGDVATVKGYIKFESCVFSYPARLNFPIFYKSPEMNGCQSMRHKKGIDRISWVRLWKEYCPTVGHVILRDLQRFCYA
jgi:hypothetical protein